MGNGRDAISFFDAQFLRVTNNSGAGGERTGHSQGRKFVNELGNFFSLNNGAFERRARDFDYAAVLQLFDIFDRFAHLRAHANDDTKQRRPSIVQSDITDQEMSTGL